MAVTITVHDVPEAVRDALAARAARDGLSLDGYLRERLVELAARPTVSDALPGIRARARAFPPLDAVRVVRDLDADRR
ncbi:hypothetical protein OMK64_16590 [Cellulomonas fimi]|uniref:FitA-like ribbon-helix-helix domain-containing protein n=1 Tax=Cellulomonas fimi TaxID=1708 RepID=UPI00234D988A|nr:hypothetical protein [Cellulomonas fimi]MDC7123149.1 hypothetical protein [Cellulomonas fimi]